MVFILLLDFNICFSYFKRCPFCSFWQDFTILLVIFNYGRVFTVSWFHTYSLLCLQEIIIPSVIQEFLFPTSSIESWGNLNKKSYRIYWRKIWKPYWHHFHQKQIPMFCNLNWARYLPYYVYIFSFCITFDKLILFLCHFYYYQLCIMITQAVY